MGTHVALLRGINVGGRTKVAMGALRSLFEDLGYDDVRTHINSGNVVFRSSKAPNVNELQAAVECELLVKARVLVRSAAELRKVVDANPFPKADPKQLYVTFLVAKPSAKRVAAIDVPAGDTGRFEIVDREVYLHLTAGYSDTKLSNAFFEKQLGVDATTRGWPTVLKLLDLASS